MKRGYARLDTFYRFILWADGLGALLGDEPEFLHCGSQISILYHSAQRLELLSNILKVTQPEKGRVITQTHKFTYKHPQLGLFP